VYRQVLRDNATEGRVPVDVTLRPVARPAAVLGPTSRAEQEREYRSSIR
jgi:hypothetical protein